MAAKLLPAILIGGPPHSGKTTLSRRLEAWLAQNQPMIAPYLFRASPDGEGMWTFEGTSAAHAEYLQALREEAKKSWTPEFATLLNRAIHNRPVPLLVDAGGKVTPELRLVAQACTHAILIASPAKADALPAWRELVADNQLDLLAEVTSVLPDEVTGFVPEQQVTATRPTLRGTITGLAANLSSDGPCFAALCLQLRAALDHDAAALIAAHKQAIAADVVVDVKHPAAPLAARPVGKPWEFAELSGVLAAVGGYERIAIYGNGPVWLYAALAALRPAAPCWVFNAQVPDGWVQPPRIALQESPPPAAALQWSWRLADATTALVRYQTSYLDYQSSELLTTPSMPTNAGVILSGRLPNWLYAAIARAYAAAPWVAIHVPQAAVAVVIRSRVGATVVGSSIAVD